MLNTLQKFTLIVLTLLFTSGLSGQKAIHKAERETDKRQITHDLNKIKRDKKELAHFKTLITDLDAALANGQFKKANQIKLSLETIMEREIHQSKHKKRQATREVGQSKKELSRERKEVRKDVVRHKPRKAKKDNKDRKDDRKDLNDDKTDRAQISKRLAHQEKILAIFRSIHIKSKADVAKINAKRALLDDFLRTMKRDRRENKEELREDLRELKEDRQ